MHKKPPPEYPKSNPDKLTASSSETKPGRSQPDLNVNVSNKVIRVKKYTNPTVTQSPAYYPLFF